MSNDIIYRKKKAEILSIEASKEQSEVRILEKMLEIDAIRKAIDDQEKRLIELRDELELLEKNRGNR